MSQQSNLCKWICLGVCCSTSLSVMADAVPKTSVQVARYSVMAPTASPAQADLMSVIINIKFPQQIATVGEALDFLLRRSGYRLVETDSPAMTILQGLPLPAVHRQLGPLTLNNALVTLAGSAYTLSIDPLHRTLSFNAGQTLPTAVSSESPRQISRAGNSQPTPLPAR